MPTPRFAERSVYNFAERAAAEQPPLLLRCERGDKLLEHESPQLEQTLDNRSRSSDFVDNFDSNYGVPEEVMSLTEIGRNAQNASQAFATTHWSVVLTAQGESAKPRKHLSDYAVFTGGHFMVSSGGRAAPPRKRKTSLRISLRCCSRERTWTPCDRKRGAYVLIFLCRSRISWLKRTAARWRSSAVKVSRLCRWKNCWRGSGPILSRRTH